jgi:hypothetical protein
MGARFEAVPEDNLSAVQEPAENHVSACRNYLAVTRRRARIASTSAVLARDDSLDAGPAADRGRCGDRTYDLLLVRHHDPSAVLPDHGRPERRVDAERCAHSCRLCTSGVIANVSVRAIGGHPEASFGTRV